MLQNTYSCVGWNLREVSIVLGKLFVKRFFDKTLNQIGVDLDPGGKYKLVFGRKVVEMRMPYVALLVSSPM